MARTALLRFAMPLVLAFACATPAPQPDKGAQAAPVALPPLIDRELFFGNPEISGAQLSPDGNYIAFIKPLDGTRNIWVKSRDEPFDTARRVTDDTKRPIPGYFWSRDSNSSCSCRTRAATRTSTSTPSTRPRRPRPGAKVPDARNLTDAKGARAFIYDVPKNEPGPHLRRPQRPRPGLARPLQGRDLPPASARCVRKNTEHIAGWVVRPRGQAAARARAPPTTATPRSCASTATAFRRSTAAPCSRPAAPCGSTRTARGSTSTTNKGDADLTALALFNPATRQGGAGRSRSAEARRLRQRRLLGATDELVGTTYDDERLALLLPRQGVRGRLRAAREEAARPRGRSSGSTPHDEQLWLVGAAATPSPARRYLFDRETKAADAAVHGPREAAARGAGADEADPLQVSDGLRDPAPSSRCPKGVPRRRTCRLIVVPHGGPWARDSWGYRRLAQFFANRGYAVLQPNFRGSTGYGKKFLNAGNKSGARRCRTTSPGA